MPSGFHNWSKTAATNATADSAVNWAEGQAPSSVNDSARAEMAVLAKWRDDNNGSLTTGGTASAYTLTTNTVFTSLALMDNQTLAFYVHAYSNAAPTLNVDGLGAKPIRNESGVALPAFALHGLYTATYYNSSSEWILHNQAGALPLTIVTTANIVPANITTALIADANITTAKLADASVTTVKIADANVTTAKLLDANVTTAKIADANVTTAKIADSNVTTAKIADANVTTAKIADANVTLAKIVNTSASRLLGNPTGGAAAPSEISLDSTLAFSGTSLKVSPSTGLTAALAVDYASKSDQQTGTATAKTVNSAHQQDHKSAVKAWGVFEGRPTATLTAGYGFSSISRTSAGVYTLTFTTAFADANYACSGSCAGAGSVYFGTKTTTTVVVNTVNLGSTPVGSDNTFDVIVCGNQ